MLRMASHRIEGLEYRFERPVTLFCTVRDDRDVPELAPGPRCLAIVMEAAHGSPSLPAVGW
jgi:hypothetical protein